MVDPRIVQQLGKAFSLVLQERKERLQITHKVELFGRPPATKNGRILPGTATLPDMKRLDSILSLNTQK